MMNGSENAVTNSQLNDQPTQVIIVDDDYGIRSLLSEFLERNGLHAFQAEDGDAMWNILNTHQVDLVVLDLNLPGEDGLSLCRRLRTDSNLPVIMLTAKTNPLDRVVGLESGADDYVCKPFEPLELLSRIRSVMRRVHPSNANESHSEEPSKIHFSGWTLDLVARHLISEQGVVVSLSGAEFRLLRIFLDHPNRILNRDQLMDMIHGRETTPFDRSIDLQVSRLRQRIEGDTKTPSIIKTVRNEGYVLASTVKVERQ